MVRLRNGPNNQGEEIKLSCELSTGTGGQDGMYTVACQCFFTNTEDPALIDEKWQETAQTLLDANPNIADEELDKEKKNWLFLEGKRLLYS